MELWDLLDQNRAPLGRTHPRGRQYPMPPRTYHTVVTVFTLDTENRILLTRRAPTKGMYPNYWEFTCGSGIAGEDSPTSAHRELLEETGIDCPAEKLHLLGTLREPSAFMDCYLCRTEQPGEAVAVTLQEGETVDYKWVSLWEMETMIHRGELPPPCALRYGFVKAALTSLLGSEAWLQPDTPEAGEALRGLDTPGQEVPV
jgi:8-oxo-dGTP pyrophosphatase MutT (NUDIX family)